MPTALNILSILILLLIIVQDFRYRAIYWWLCPILAMLLVVKEIVSTTYNDFLLLSWLVNLAIVSIQLLVVYIYTKLRRKKDRLNFLKSFGLGDILCLYALCFLAQPYLFVLLCCIGYIIALIALLVFPNNFKTVPLAGWLSGGGLLFIVYELTIGNSLWEYPFTLNVS